MTASSFISLICAGIAFTGGHFLFSSTPLRAKLASRLGEKGFQILFSLLSLATLAWLILSYRHAPTAILWPTAAWTHWLAIGLMPLALLLFVGALRLDNPTSAGPQDINRPPLIGGVFALTRHPMMWGFTLWASLHIIANGDLASLIFFGSFFVLAFFGTFAIDAKFKRKQAERWSVLFRATSNWPFLALIGGRNTLQLKSLVLPGGFALILYIALIAGHGILFGTPVLGN